MGKHFGNLTNTAVSDPNGGSPQWFNQGQVQSGALARAMTPQPGQLQPSSANITGQVQPPGIADPGGSVSFNQPTPNLPQMAKPSFGQAASIGATPGGANALSPGLSKAGKLVALLSGGIQGALAGQQASEQSVIQSGGHRSSGMGTGFESGYMLPWQRAMQGQQLQQAQAQTALTQAQSAMVPTPYGMMPAGLAKVIFPAAIRAQGQENAAQTNVQGRQAVANTQAGSREKVAKINQGMGVPLDDTVANILGIPELAGQSLGKGSWDNINKAIEAKGYHTQDMGQNGPGENQGMWLMDKVGNRIRQISDQSLMFNRGASYAQNKAEVVTDPNNPGNAYYTTAAQAMSQHLPSPLGAAPTAAKAITKSAVAGPIGNEINAFNTALQHADLLQSAMSALNNGDQQTLNALKNRFKTEFGSSDVTNFQTIASAYSREINKMLSSGHITDAEIKDAGASIPAKASPQQILGALQAYKALATSKMKIRQQQVEQGMQGKPNFPANTGAPKNGNGATGGSPKTAADYLKKFYK